MCRANEVDPRDRPVAQATLDEQHCRSGLDGDRGAANRPASRPACRLALAAPSLAAVCRAPRPRHRRACRRAFAGSQLTLLESPAHPSVLLPESLSLAATCPFGAGFDRSLQSCSRAAVRGPERFRVLRLRQRPEPLLPPRAWSAAIIAERRGCVVACRLSRARVPARLRRPMPRAFPWRHPRCAPWA